MSAERIDVLAVMDDATRMCGGVTDETGARVAEARAAVAELVEKVEETRKFLTNEQWGTYHYMEGSDVYGDLRKHADILAAALARCGGAS